MEQKIQKGSFIKACGGDFGLYFDGRKWVSFECLGCAIAKGLIVPALRLHNGSHPKLNKLAGYNFVERHDKIVHKQWLASGKPH